MNTKSIRAEVNRVLSKMKLRDDREYLMRNLRQYPTEYWIKIVEGYLAEWRKGMDSEEVSYRKQNAGRFKANTWIREHDHWK